MTNAESANMTAKTTSATAGASQVPNRRYSFSSNGTDAARPSTANSAVPPAPATTAVPARNPMWCNTCGSNPTTTAIPATIPFHSVRIRPDGTVGAAATGAGPATARVPGAGTVIAG